MPLRLDQNVGTLVWSPLAGAKPDSRSGTDASWEGSSGPAVRDH
jgi:hypothetical protein